MTQVSFTGGLNLHFFKQAEFESFANKSQGEQSLVVARNALRLIMMGWPESWRELVYWPVIKAVFIERNPHYLRAMRFAFQEGFHHLLSQLRAIDLNEVQLEQVQLYLSNCLVYLPYSDLNPYEAISIPQFINNEWVAVDYCITPIELTKITGWRRYFVPSADRVFAYGLQPIVQQSAQPHLIFMGTTYPAGQGFSSHIDADFKTFDSVGTHLYASGRENILRWLDKQTNKIHVCGISLGGALSLLCAMDQGARIYRVDALNPPGLAELGYKNKYDRSDEGLVKPRVVIQLQADDPVSTFGVWKKEWELIHVLPPKDKKGPNPFCDHFLNYAGFAQTRFTYLSVEEENKKRIYRNFFIFTLGRWLVYQFAVWPFGGIIRPSAYFLWEQVVKKPLFIALGLSLSLLILSSTLGVNALGVGAMMLGGICALLVQRGFNNAKPGVYDSLHHPLSPRNPQYDMYNSMQPVTHQFTHDELGTYYRVMRCLKGKEQVPALDKPLKHVKGYSKRSFLLAATNSEISNSEVLVHATRAKIMHIKNTLHHVKRIGFDNREQLNAVLRDEYTHYQHGKRY